MQTRLSNLGIAKLFFKEPEIKEEWYGCFSKVLKVWDGKKHYTIKFPFEEPFEVSSSYNHLKNESMVLKKAKPVEKINHLITEYHSLEFIALLKEYFEGVNLYSANKPLKNKNLKEYLESTVLQLHNLGLAGLDICNNNLFVSPDNKDIRLIELGMALFRNSPQGKYFGVYRQQDLFDLKNIISAYS